MIRNLRKRIRNTLFGIRQNLQVDRAMILQGQIRGEQVLARGRLEKLSDAGFCVFSQADEDGILHWLIERLGVSNTTFVEFGSNDYRESNTRFLLMSRNWSGLVIDGAFDNISAVRGDEIAHKYDLQTLVAFVTRDNIAALINQAGFGGRLGVLSIDIDGVDYWVLQRIGMDADIIVVEFNDFLGELPVSVPYSPTFKRLQLEPYGVYWGASLTAFRHLLEGRGYVFVGTNLLGINAFFVHRDRADTIDKWLDKIVAHRCVMREARDSRGSLSGARYRDVAKHVADLPLVRVDTGATMALGEACRS